MSFSKKLILAAGLLLIFATQAAQSLQCYQCKDVDGKCKGAKLEKCGGETTTAATTEAAAAETTTAAATPAAGSSNETVAGREQYINLETDEEVIAASESELTEPFFSETTEPETTQEETTTAALTEASVAAGNASEAPAPGESEAPAAATPAPAAPAPQAFIQHQDEGTSLAPPPAPAGNDSGAAAPPAEISTTTAAAEKSTGADKIDWFCATLTGKINKTTATFKGCSNKKDDCTDLKAIAKGIESASCKTCNKDKCNTGFNVKPISLPFLVFVVILFISAC